jgi:hypothetical protein
MNLRLGSFETLLDYAPSVTIRVMTRFQSLVLACSFSLAVFPMSGMAQSCPKVAYTTVAATTGNMVASVNCLVAKNAAGHSEVNKAGLMVESFPVVGPQHTRSYRKIVLAMISVPAGNETKTALATSDNPSASVSATAGAECKIKINPDNTVDGQCNQTGGSLFIVFNN